MQGEPKPKVCKTGLSISFLSYSRTVIPIPAPVPNYTVFIPISIDGRPNGQPENIMLSS